MRKLRIITYTGAKTEENAMKGEEGTRILVVDDEAIIGFMIEKTLTHADTAVHVTTTIAEAQQAVEEWNPHCILIDLNLGTPEDGIIFSRWVRTHKHSTEPLLVALTAYPASEEWMPNFDKYLRKPFTADKLQTVISELL